MPGSRTNEAIALEQKIGEETGKVRSIYSDLLRRHGYSDRVKDLSKTLKEAALASKRGSGIKLI